MDQSLIYLIAGLGALFMSILPFGVFLGLGSIAGIKDPSSPILILALYIIVICASFLGGFGGFTIIQKQSCGKIKNIKQIATNAGISTLIAIIILSLAVFITFLRTAVVGLFPPNMDPIVALAIGYSYYVFWGGLYGFATGGFLSSGCGT